jgi:hypothetical protein
MKRLLITTALSLAFLTATQSSAQEPQKTEKGSAKRTKKKEPTKTEKKGDSKSLDDPTFHKGGKAKQ